MTLRGACTRDVAVLRPENEIASAMELPRKIIITYHRTTTEKITTEEEYDRRIFRHR
ncbi:MAG: hypothetical protein HN736_08415 [Anaerolineae bacterium]|nr:hypothetical protein [Anaerolineae bacterium]MBT4310128.1 hypothetical protein [Anaerolineae bacterium]MBT4457934.1 hypothetical protein [Anaerolineae bacterium]MBT6062494.1 hypothetical protein [Anaerolineae bacterium]MBT6811268.1 hypothetical protein [Anaerolineae bacterium]